MSTHVLLNLLNELGKSDKMRGLPSILSHFCNGFNEFYYKTSTNVSFYLSYDINITLKSNFSRKKVIILSLCTQRCYGRHNVPRKSVNHYSCIGIRYAKLFEAAKTHVQIMRFTCCLNMAFNLTKPIWALIILHDDTRESVTAFTDHSPMILFAKTLTLWRRYAVRKFDVDAILF